MPESTCSSAWRHFISGILQHCLCSCINTCPDNFFGPHSHELKKQEADKASRQGGHCADPCRSSHCFLGDKRPPVHGRASGVTNECGPAPRPAPPFPFITRAAMVLSPNLLWAVTARGQSQHLLHNDADPSWESRRGHHLGQGGHPSWCHWGRITGEVRPQQASKGGFAIGMHLV